MWGDNNQFLEFSESFTGKNSFLNQKIKRENLHFSITQSNLVRSENCTIRIFRLTHFPLTHSNNLGFRIFSGMLFWVIQTILFPHVVSSLLGVLLTLKDMEHIHLMLWRFWLNTVWILSVALVLRIALEWKFELLAGLIELVLKF